MENNESLPEASQDRATRSSKFFSRLHRWQTQARRLWWIPAATLILALGVGAFLLWHAPPKYVSTGEMIVNVKLSIPEGSAYLEEWQNFYGTQTALMQGQPLLNRPQTNLQAENPDSNLQRLNLV